LSYPPPSYARDVPFGLASWYKYWEINVIPDCSLTELWPFWGPIFRMVITISLKNQTNLLSIRFRLGPPNNSRIELILLLFFVSIDQRSLTFTLIASRMLANGSELWR